MAPEDSAPTAWAGRRDFLWSLGSAAAALALPTVAAVRAAPSPASPAETAVRALWESLSDEQKKEICFDWDYREPSRGLLRTFVANHWQITRPCIRSDFFTPKQRWLIHDIFKGMVHPAWYPRFLKQLREDTHGHEWGADQSIAIFGRPDQERFQFVITGRHLTLRADGHTEGRVALGGPIFYGHAASGFNESVHHPGNVFWPQALAANRVFQLLEPPQRQRALLVRRPAEEAIHFRGRQGPFPGLPLSELSGDQLQAVRDLLRVLVAPFRVEERESVRSCLRDQGGLRRCSIAFYQEGDLGDDGEWDNWRLEGPAFVWYFRGTPHVHVWVHVASDSDVEVHPRNGRFLHPGQDPLLAPRKQARRPAAFRATR